MMPDRVMHKQKFRHDPANGVYGDCYRTAVACCLGLDRDAVPHVYHDGCDGEEGERRMTTFLRSVGVVKIDILYQGGISVILPAVGHMNPGVYHLLCGKSRNGVGHCVVCRDGKIVHDPALDDSGIVAPADDGLYWIVFFGTLTATEA